MVNPFLSIIVPAYKTENTIVRCLDSIFSQIEGTVLEDMVEVLAVNDCSPDNVGKKIDEYRSSHPALLIVTHERNKGAAVARNTGIEQTRGAYFLHIDSDDALKPGSIERTHTSTTLSKGLYLLGAARGRWERMNVYRRAERGNAGFRSANQYSRSQPITLNTPEMV